MSPSLPNPVSASPKLPRSRSSRAPGRGSTAKEEGAAWPGAARAPPAATAVAGGRLGPLGGVTTAGLVAPEAAFNAAGPPPQDPAAVRLLSSLHLSSVKREERGRRSDREKERRKREEIRPLWYRAGLDLAATAAAFASTTATTRSLPLAGRPRPPPPSSAGTASRQLDDRRSGRCKRRRLSSSSLAGRGACYGVLGEPQ